MQIHELNTFTGQIGADTFVAIDNGTDTGKISVPNLLRDVSEEVAATNARIDNIISSPAPSEQEIIDARKGANNITYQSLGQAIRDQFDEIDKDFDQISKMVYGKNRFDETDLINGYYLGSSGNLVESATWGTSGYCYVNGASTMRLSELNIDQNIRFDKTPFYLCTYDANKTFIEQVGSMPSNPITIGDGVEYIRFSFHIDGTPILDQKVMLEAGSNRTAYVPFDDHIELITDKTLTLENVPADAKAVGYQLKHLTDALDFTQVALTMTQRKLVNANTGVISDGNSDNWRVSQYVPINPNSKIMVRTDHFFGWGMVVFYDSDKNYISGIAAEQAVTYMRNQIVDTPAGAAYAVIGFLYHENFPEPFLFVGDPQDALPSRIWSNKKWAVIGDSLTAYSFRTSCAYYDYIAGATGINLYNMGFSGSGYAKGNDNFMTKISDVPLDSDVITIFGSGNDGSAGLPLGTSTDSGTETLGGCINTTLDNLFAIMPVAQIGIITPTPWINNTPADNGWMENYSNLLVEICRLRSIPCLDLFHCSNLNPNSAAVRAAAYSRDGGNGVHPNELGHKIIASRIRAFLETLVI